MHLLLLSFSLFLCGLQHPLDMSSGQQTFLLRRNGLINGFFLFLYSVSLYWGFQRLQKIKQSIIRKQKSTACLFQSCEVWFDQMHAGLLNGFAYSSAFHFYFYFFYFSESKPHRRSRSHEHSTDGANGPVPDHSLGGGELPGKALWVHAGMPEHHGEGLQQNPLHQGREWTVSLEALVFCFSTQPHTHTHTLSASWPRYPL